MEMKSWCLEMECESGLATAGLYKFRFFWISRPRARTLENAETKNAVSRLACGAGVCDVACCLCPPDNLVLQLYASFSARVSVCGVCSSLRSPCRPCAALRCAKPLSNLYVLVGGVGWTLPCVCIGMQLTLLYPKIYRIHAFCF